MEILTPFLKQLQENLQEFQDQVDIQFNYKNQTTRTFILNQIFEKTRQQKTILTFYEQFQQALQRLQQLNCYENIKVKYYPGQEPNKIQVQLDFNKKSPYFASVAHQMDKNGGAFVQVKSGLRNQLGLCDKITFEYNKAINQSQNSNYNVSIDFPYLGASNMYALQISQSFQQKMIDEECDENSNNLNFRVFNQENQNSFNFEYSKRYNAINFLNPNEIQNLYFKNEQFLPSKKKSLRISLQPINSLQKKKVIQVDEGARLNFQGEVTLPTSQVHFIKTEFSWTKYFNSSLRLTDKYPIFKKWNLEQSGQIGIVKSLFNQPLFINDRFQNSQLRGFSDFNPYIVSNDNKIQNQKIINNVDFYCKQALKLNIYNYPHLKKAGILVFIHGSFGYFYRTYDQLGAIDLNQGWLNHLHQHIKMSTGLGASYNLGMAKLELLYNFWHFSKNPDKRSNFQIRFSLDD